MNHRAMDGPEQSASKPTEATLKPETKSVPVPVGMIPKSEADLEKRLAVIETKLEGSKENRENHLKIITIIFGTLSGIVAIVAISLTILGVLAKNEASSARADVKDAIKDMEKRFEALAGDALKKPSIQISTKQAPLHGQTFDVPHMSVFPIFPLFIKNTGSKTTDPLSIRIYCSESFQLNGTFSMRSVPSNEKDYPYCYYMDDYSGRNGASIAPQETWTLTPELGQLWKFETNIVQCKMLIFYGVEKPAEAHFTLKFQ